MDRSELLELRNSYLRTWKAALRALLNWPEDAVEAWVARYHRDLVSDSPDLFHESSIYYIVPLLIPRALHARLKSRDMLRLRERIQLAIEYGGHAWPWQLKESGSNEVSLEAVDSFEEFRATALRDMLWFSDANAVAYDWGKAKDRVQDILREYGESLEEPLA